jgi:hypothetical protein
MMQSSSDCIICEPIDFLPVLSDGKQRESKHTYSEVRVPYAYAWCCLRVIKPAFLLFRTPHSL